MKRYEVPEINIAKFNTENVVTESSLSNAIMGLEAQGISTVGITHFYWRDMTVTP